MENSKMLIKWLRHEVPREQSILNIIEIDVIEIKVIEIKVIEIEVIKIEVIEIKDLKMEANSSCPRLCLLCNSTGLTKTWFVIAAGNPILVLHYLDFGQEHHIPALSFIEISGTFEPLRVPTLWTVGSQTLFSIWHCLNQIEASLTIVQLFLLLLESSSS